MDDLLLPVLDFAARHWELVVGAVLIPVVLFWIQWQWQRKRNWLEGRQQFRQAKRFFDDAQRSWGKRNSDEDKEPRELIGRAIELTDDALVLGYREMEVYLLRGVAYRALEEMDKALIEFRKAVKCARRRIETRYELGVAYQDVGNETAAAGEFRRVCQLHPRNEKERNLKSHAEDRLRHLEESYV